jgi:hypothetical protein
LAGFGQSLLGGVGGLVGITSAAAVAGLAIKGFNTALAAAAEAETALVTMGATIQSMGIESEISAGKVARLAEALMPLTNFDDEALMKASEIFMRMESFDPSNLEQMLQATADYAAGTGQDMASAAQAVSMALETGNTRALKFSKAIREQITEMVTAGDSAGALALIMSTLNDKFGGQAVAQMDTYKGSTVQLKIAMGEFWEKVGDGLEKQGKDFNVWLTDNVVALTGSVKAANLYSASIDYAFRKVAGTELSWIEKSSFHWALHSKALNAAKAEYEQWAAYGDRVNAWLDAQPEKIDENTGAFVDLAAAEKAAAEAAKLVSQGYADLYSTVGTLQGVTDSYNKTQDDLIVKQGDAQAAIDAAKGHYSEAGEHMQGLRQDLADVNKELAAAALAFEDESRRAILAMMAQKLSADGWQKGEMEALLAVGEAWGIYSSEVITQSENIMGALENIDTTSLGDLQAYAEWMIANPNITMSFDYFETHHITSISDYISKTNPYAPGSPDWRIWNQANGYAGGGSFVVPSGYPNDSYPMRVQSGERVSVTPAGASSSDNSDILQELRELRTYLPRSIRDAVQQVVQ